MSVRSRAAYQTPDVWTVYGHSWFNGATGPLNQTGRVDALLRSALDVEYSNWRNAAVPGARLVSETRAIGGWTRVYQDRVPPARTSQPYAPDGGAAIMAWGINDLGAFTASSQMRAALINALRGAVSRYRASTIWENDNATRWSYGAGFSVLASGNDNSSGGSVHSATATTNATATLTLPSDYNGEPIAISLLGCGGATGASWSLSGTAGVTGTMSTSNTMPAVAFSHCPVVKRITNLTSANAGQSIVLTVTAVDSGGNAFIDCAWIESNDPPPVLVQGIARLTAAGYANALYVNWTGTEATKDVDVQNVNADFQSVVAEFDSMVQFVDVDSAILKDATLTLDGIHPNERGAGKIVDVYLAAERRLTPRPGSTSNTLQFNNPSRRAGSVRRPRLSSFWYTADAAISGTGYTCVAGDMFALPFLISEPRDTYSSIQVEVTALTSGTSTIRYGWFDDIGMSGYPGLLPPGGEPTSGGALSITSTGLKPTATAWLPDPGMWWLVLKVETAGVGHVLRALAGPSPLMPPLDSTGAGTLSPVAWKLTGQASGAFSGGFPAGAALVATAPMIALKKA